MDLLSLPDHSVRRGVNADAVVEVEGGDGPVSGSVDAAAACRGLVGDAVSREAHLATEHPPGAALVERCGGDVGHGCGQHRDGMFGLHVVWPGMVVEDWPFVCRGVLRKRGE